jgi:hypothetical protein
MEQFTKLPVIADSGKKYIVMRFGEVVRQIASSSSYRQEMKVLVVQATATLWRHNSNTT